MTKLWLSQQISSDPDFPNIKRFVNIRNAYLQAQYEQIIIEAHVTYFDENDNNVSSKFKTEIGNWIINNNDTTTVRDMAGNPVPNPEYDEETNPVVEQFIKKPSFDYFFEIITTKDISLITLLSMHIDFDDELGRFNF